jgi:ATP-binding cassette, subfamily F, member 3
MIILNDVTLKRGDRTLFDSLSLTVHGGQRVGVVGRNGVGKSTLFALLRGRLLPEAGDVQVPPGWRIAFLAQETEPSPRSALDWVLDGDRALRRVQRRIAAAEDRGDDAALARLYSELEDVDGYTAEARAATILSGLGFHADQFQDGYETFSGGWRIRLNLAQALMAPSDLLLLDEPTNHLDIDALLWLEQWLVRYPGTLLTIAHDRGFLDSVATHIVHLEHGKAFTYRGGYSSFERQRSERLTRQAAEYRQQQHQIRHIQSFVDRFRAKASKARQVQSRLKALERLQAAAPAYADSPYQFEFPDPKKLSNPLLALDEAALGYGEPAVVRDATLRIYPGSRVGVLGANGAGKSTLMRTLAGELPLLGGRMVRGEHSPVGYFAQHQLEQLDGAASAIAQLERLDPAAQPQKVRNFLGGWGFSGDMATRPVATLSGGEKARLVLALLAWQRPAILLLDEPTNHLDLEMRQALSVALQDYQGALVIVSHDRELLQRSVDEFWLVKDARVSDYTADLDTYLAGIRAGFVDAGGTDGSAYADPAPARNRREARQSAAELRRATQPLRDGVKRLEREIEGFTKALKDIERRLADTEVYRALSSDELSAMLAERGRLQRKIETAESRWLEQQQALEAALDQPAG